MLSAIRKLFRTRGSTEQRKLQPDCEAPDEEEQSEDKKSIKRKKQQQKASNKQRRQLVTRIDESGGTGRPPTNSSGSTGEHCDSQGGGTGFKCGGGVSFGDCNKIGSNNTESSSSSSSTTTNCSSSTGTDISNSNDSGTSSSNSRNSCHSTGPVNQEVTESGDRQQQKQQQEQQQQEQLKQLESQTQIAEDYEEEEDDEYDDNFEEDFNDELEDGPVAFIAEAPPKQQHHYQKQQLKQQQQQEHKKSANNQSPSKPFLAGQLKKSTPQTLTSHQHHHSSKTDVDQLLTGSVSQQYRKDAVRGNLEELRAAESINYRSVVYEYSFRVKDTPSNMRVFTDPGDRRIEAIARSCGTQIQLERPKASSHYYEMRARRVTVQAPDLHSLEKCCRQFDDRFPHFYVCGGLGLSSKSIKRVYVDEFNGQPVQ